jgi:ribonuclease BN (tRNA processing enzyme)
VSELVFIGTGDAFGAGGRRQSAMLLRAPSGGLLIDCGMTTGSGLAALGIDRGEIDAIAISHFHGDHLGGVPLFLLAALYEDRREAPLLIAGPPGVEERVRRLAAAMGYAIEGRRWSFPIHFQELSVGAPAEVGPARIGCFVTHHQPDVEPRGLLISSGPERLAYSGDTGWFDDLPRCVAGSSLFVCECTYADSIFEYHLSYAELTARKEEFDCGRIILTHLGTEMTDRRGRCDFETADDGLLIKL